MSKLSDAIGKVKQSRGKQQFCFGFATAKGADNKPKYALLIGAKGKTAKSEADKILPAIEKYLQGACWSSADGATVWFWGNGLSAFHIQQMIRTAKAETNTTHRFEFAKEAERKRALELPEENDELDPSQHASGQFHPKLLEEYRKTYEHTAAQCERLLEKDFKTAAPLQERLRHAEAKSRVGHFEQATLELKSIQVQIDEALLAHQKQLAEGSARPPCRRPAEKLPATERIELFKSYTEQVQKTKNALERLPAHAPFREGLENRVKQAEALGKKGNREQAAAQLKVADRLIEIALHHDLTAKGPEAEALSHQYEAVLRITDGDDPRAHSAFAALEGLTAPVPKQQKVSAFNGKMKSTLVHFHELQNSHPERAEALKVRIREAETASRIGKYEQAIDLLNAVDRQMRQIAEEVAFEEWRQQSVAALAKKNLRKCRTPIGRGGQGAIYKLEPPDESVPEGLPNLVVKTGARDVLEHEANMYEEIGPHPNVARCLGRDDRLGGLVMESITGGDMKSGVGNLLKKLETGEIRQEEYWGVMQFTLQRTLEVMDHLASRDIVHHDLKPDNIMYDAATGEVKVIDLGTSSKTGTKETGFTVGLASPEALRMEKSAPDHDMFSLGATAYEAIEKKRFAYGAEPHQNPMELVNSGQYKSPLKEASLDPATKAPIKEAGAYAPGLKTAYVQFLEWALNADPAKRPTAKEALEHPFMKDRILGDDAARTLIREINRTVPAQKHTEPADPQLAYVAVVRKRFAELNQKCTAIIHQKPECKVGLMKLAHEFTELMTHDNFDADKPAKADRALDAFSKAIEDAAVEKWVAGQVSKRTRKRD